MTGSGALSTARGTVALRQLACRCLARPCCRRGVPASCQRFPAKKNPTPVLPLYGVPSQDVGTAAHCRSSPRQHADCRSFRSSATPALSVPSLAARSATRARALRAGSDVLYTEPDYVVDADRDANEAFIAFSNHGHPEPRRDGSMGVAGTAGPTGRPWQAAFVVAAGPRSWSSPLLKTKINYDQPDLAAGCWTNPGGDLAGLPPGARRIQHCKRQCDAMDDLADRIRLPQPRDARRGVLGTVGDDGSGSRHQLDDDVLPSKWLEQVPRVDRGEPGSRLDEVRCSSRAA